MRGHLIDMDDDLWTWVGEVAGSCGVSRAAYVRQALDDRRAAGLEAKSPKELAGKVKGDGKRLAKRPKGEPAVIVPPGGAITVGSASMPGAGEPCDHPKSSQHVLGWGTLCGKCGDKVR